MFSRGHTRPGESVRTPTSATIQSQISDAGANYPSMGSLPSRPTLILCVCGVSLTLAESPIVGAHCSAYVCIRFLSADHYQERRTAP